MLCRHKRFMVEQKMLSIKNKEKRVKKMSQAAIIEITHEQNIKQAIDSVWESRCVYSELHIIDQTYDEDNAFYYEGFQEKIKALEENDIKVMFESSISIETIQTEYIVNIHPWCHVTRSGINELQNRTKKNSSTQWETHFGLETHINLVQTSFFYGYFLITAFIFLIWSRFEQSKMFKSTDVTMTAIVKKGKYKNIAVRTNNISKYVLNPETAKILSTKNYKACVLNPEIEGLDFVHQNLKENKYFKTGWFHWLPFCKFWFIFYAFYWVYNLTISIYFIRILMKILARKIPASEIYYSFSSMFLFLTYILNWIMVIYASSRWYTFNWQFTMSFFSPFYALTFPVMLVYARFKRYKK